LKKLYLIRHARANLKKAKESDFDRNLSQEGENDARWLGEKIKEKGIYPNQIISSSARRALQTAEIISQAIGYPSTSIHSDLEVYDSEMEGLIKIIQGLDDMHQQVFLIGHNPAISMTVTYLTRHGLGNMAPGGLLCCKFHVDTWQAVSKDSGTFDFIIEPK
jgi:phosphohistidine phosphatase